MAIWEACPAHLRGLAKSQEAQGCQRHEHMRVHMAARDAQAQLDCLGDPRQEIHPSHREVADPLKVRPCTGASPSGMSIAPRDPRAEKSVCEVLRDC